MNSESIILLSAVVVFGLFVIAVIAYFHRSSSKLDKNFFIEKWSQIDKMSQHEVGWVQAVIEADKLLDSALKKSGFKGKTMGERLVSASRSFRNKDQTWAAHKLRNRVVHETSIKLRQRHVDSALSAFKKALIDLGAL